eukprot:GHVQ01005248.1.p1 GENE.GHVQ01005248.1~~GHVQ01005248.1.p1  ORF type:complete len:551 (+),score=68.36 GHVQ01005248.1:175-1827(+)
MRLKIEGDSQKPHGGRGRSSDEMRLPTTSAAMFVPRIVAASSPDVLRSTATHTSESPSRPRPLDGPPLTVPKRRNIPINVHPLSSNPPGVTYVPPRLPLDILPDSSSQYFPVSTASTPPPNPSPDTVRPQPNPTVPQHPTNSPPSPSFYSPLPAPVLPRQAPNPLHPMPPPVVLPKPLKQPIPPLINLSPPGLRPPSPRPFLSPTLSPPLSPPMPRPGNVPFREQALSVDPYFQHSVAVSPTAIPPGPAAATSSQAAESVAAASGLAGLCANNWCGCWPVWLGSCALFVVYFLLLFAAVWMTSQLFTRGLKSRAFYNGGGYWIITACLTGFLIGSLVGGLVTSCAAGALPMGAAMSNLFASVVLVGKRGAWLGSVGGLGVGGIGGLMAKTEASLGLALGLSIGFLVGLIIGFVPFMRDLKINDRYIRRGLMAAGSSSRHPILTTSSARSYSTPRGTLVYPSSVSPHSPPSPQTPPSPRSAYSQSGLSAPSVYVPVGTRFLSRSDHGRKDTLYSASRTSRAGILSDASAKVSEEDGTESKVSAAVAGSVSS